MLKIEKIKNIYNFIKNVLTKAMRLCIILIVDIYSTITQYQGGELLWHTEDV